MKIKYVGLKSDGEAAFAAESGIDKWMPGDSFEIVNPAIASRMLMHPDVFAEDAAENPKKTETQAQAGSDPFAGLDDAGVREIAKANGLKIQGLHLLKADNLRAKVLGALNPAA